jgi:hypothetical protein
MESSNIHGEPETPVSDMNPKLRAIEDIAPPDLPITDVDAAEAEHVKGGVTDDDGAVTSDTLSVRRRRGWDLDYDGV